MRAPSSPPRIFLSHLGFRVLIRMAALLPDSLSSLRQLSQLERPASGVYALERAMPMCLLKALAIPMARSGKATWQRPLESFVDAFRQRKRSIQQELSSGPGWRVSPPLSAWPRLDFLALAVRVPQGVLNASSWPSNDTLSTFQLVARVGSRLYRAIAPLLYPGSIYEREMAVRVTSVAEQCLDGRRECLMSDWQSVRRRLRLQYSPWREMNAQRWFRDWLQEQAVGLQLALYAFDELLHHVSSTKLFFYYYAIDHCERSRESYQRRRLRMRLPPAPLRVNLPLRHAKAFAKEFECADKDMIKADNMCKLFGRPNTALHSALPASPPILR
ncbi:hypothetical protein HPB48_022665 [Haemaphysalis longicornis]|uniref:Peptidase M13 C-terminal domain-containing protein n=1 Tax=Haemaphysalis longicornis TaxID=44386 RepID=A0A9J6FZV3_HAELO|nr:hypothetical protein HPB48_022665 [Haemaphysalis longicornis]